MNTALIEQVANQWVADYTISFLNDGAGAGAVLVQQRRWCAWLQRQRDVLAQRFQVHLLETGHLTTSAAVIQERWEEWIYTIFPSLTDQWLADCQD